MVVSIRLQQFRSYADTSFEFSPYVNIIVGPNASGKTNLLEAILIAASGRSYRVRDADVVMFGCSWARIDAYADDDQRTVKLVLDPVVEKTYEIAGRTFRHLSLDRALPVVLFEPTHLTLLTGSPEHRRDYLDTLLQQTTVGYGTTVRAYRRTLGQRNALLKSGRATGELLFPWNVRLSQLGAVIVRQRTELVGVLNEKIGSLYKDLSRGNVHVTATYRCLADPTAYETQMLRQLEARAPDDTIRGFTSFGPHREDLEVLFDGHRAEEVASRGEMRSAVLSLKIIELQILEEKRRLQPLFLLDDVFSELDGARREALTTHLTTHQTFITTTDADVAVHQFSRHSTVIPINQD